MLVRRHDENPFGWYLDCWSAAIEALAAGVLAATDEAARGLSAEGDAAARDVLKPLYESLLPKQVRHRLGEYYTPDWLAEHLLDVAGYRGLEQGRLLDPACGSGTFLLAAIRRALGVAGNEAADGRARAVLGRIVGFDLNPLAVLSARANYVLALRPWLKPGEAIDVPVHLRDAVLARDGAGEHAEAFDLVVGNPPWIVWDHLPENYRRATEPLWREYGLFSLSSAEARHGGAKKDLSALMTCVAADRYLKPRGRLAFVLPQNLFQTKGAGDGFRRFQLGEGAPLRVLRVDDLSSGKPFAGAANWTATAVFEKGSPTEYPVAYYRWSDGRAPLRLAAEPIDPDRPTSPWLVRPAGVTTPLSRVKGRSDYEAHLGANSGGANAVYWLEVLGAAEGGVLVRNRSECGRGSTPQTSQVIEADLVYPLLRWGDVRRWHAAPSGHILLVQDPGRRRGIDAGRMQQDYPRTLAYLARFEPLLRRRAAYRRYQERAAFYSMYDVGPYTTAPHKVVWRRMDRRLSAAVAGEFDDPVLGRRPIVPQETCVLIAAASADEAHYLCALLNSAVLDFLVRAHSVRGGKGFGTPGMLQVVRLRRFEPDRRIHAELAALSRQAHAETAHNRDADRLQGAIDRAAGKIYALGAGEVAAMRRELDGP